MECYFVWEVESDKPLRIESPPNGLCSLVFNFQDTYHVSNHKYEKRKVPNCFMTGQALSNYTLHINGKISVMGIAFKPAAIYNFYKLSMYELTDERICFSTVQSNPDSEVESWTNMAKSHPERIKILETYLLELIKKTGYGDPAIIDAANEIFYTKGKINVTELLDKVPMSRRNFERRFLEEVGVSPKTYAKIRRFGYTCSLMAGNRDINLMDVLYKGGYYDQSHFIKDFKYFSGRTPRKYAKTNVELANYVDRISLVERRLQEGI